MSEDSFSMGIGYSFDSPPGQQFTVVAAHDENDDTGKHTHTEKSFPLQAQTANALQLEYVDSLATIPRDAKDRDAQTEAGDSKFIKAFTAAYKRDPGAALTAIRETKADLDNRENEGVPHEVLAQHFKMLSMEELVALRLQVEAHQPSTGNPKDMYAQAREHLDKAEDLGAYARQPEREMLALQRFGSTGDFFKSLLIANPHIWNNDP